MPFNIEYDSDQDIIVSTFIGEVTMSLVKEYIGQLLPVLEKTQCTRLLSDSRNSDLILTSMDIIQFPKLAEQSPLTANLKRAILGNPERSGYELYEAMSITHGQNVKTFETRADAVAWLLADEK